MEHEKQNSDYSVKSAAEKFFENNNFIYDNFDFDREVQRFIEEMNKGLKGAGTLPMLPTFVSADLHPTEGVKVITVDVGGTNLRISVAEIIGNSTTISNTLKCRLPGIDESISFEEFISIMANKIEPYLEFSNMISLSFAQEVYHTEDLDGSVIELSKELHIEGIEGKPLGKSLKHKLSGLGHCNVEVILINDTVGVANSMIQRKNEFSSFIGLVLGTGTNSCYMENCQNIKKISCKKDDDMFINVESGSYVPSIVSDFDIEYDKTTQKPNTAILEKMISGRYLGSLFYLVVKKACNAPLFSPDFAKNFAEYSSITTEQMSRFYADEYSENILFSSASCKQDIEILKYICDKLVCRAANLLAVKILALATKASKKNQKPVLCIAEGTTYFGLKGFDQIVKTAVMQNSKEIDILIESQEDAALKGIGNIGICMISKDKI